MWNTALFACLFVFTINSILAYQAVKVKNTEGDTEGDTEGQLYGFLLAFGRLKSYNIVSLLLSGCFGLSSMFYQVWLGYSIGVWGLLIQGAWALGYVLLSKFSLQVRGVRSLHHFVGNKFGTANRIIAACLSIIGITFMAGWESNIGSAVVSGTMQLDSAIVETVETGNLESPDSSVSSESTSKNYESSAFLLISVIVIGCVVYTIIGGLKGNASADVFNNILKIGGYLFLMMALISNFRSTDGTGFFSGLFPSFSVVLSEFGLWALLTNIAFSLTWQFVDSTTWQSVIAGASSSKAEDTKNTLNWTGLTVFLTPGIVGTLVGVSLINAPGVTPDNILVVAVENIIRNPLAQFLVFAVVFSSILSLINGLFLAVSFASILDIVNVKTKLEDLDSDNALSRNALFATRFIVFAVGLLSFWGVEFIRGYLNLDLFQFVYVMVISQLSIFGPVIVGLLGRTSKSQIFVVVMPLSFVIGILLARYGSLNDMSWLADGAGTFTLIISFVFSYLLTSKN